MKPKLTSPPWLGGSVSYLLIKNSCFFLPLYVIINLYIYTTPLKNLALKDKDEGGFSIQHLGPLGTLRLKP